MDRSAHGVTNTCTPPASIHSHSEVSEVEMEEEKAKPVHIQTISYMSNNTIILNELSLENTSDDVKMLLSEMMGMDESVSPGVSPGGGGGCHVEKKLSRMSGNEVMEELDKVIESPIGIGHDGKAFK